TAVANGRNAPRGRVLGRGTRREPLMDCHRFGTVLVGVALAGCASKPVTAPRAVVPEPVPSELRAAATTGKRFGHMVAVGIGVSNGTTKDYLVSAERVFAVDRDGQRLAALSANQAARKAGGATARAAGIQRPTRGAAPPCIRAAVRGHCIRAAC